MLSALGYSGKWFDVSLADLFLMHYLRHLTHTRYHFGHLQSTAFICENYMGVA